MTNINHHSPAVAPLPPDERRRRKREAILIVVILFIVALLTYVQSTVIDFGDQIPTSGAILMFILININLLLLLLLIFLVFRNLVKLLYDRKRRVMGAKLRTRLVVAFIALTLVPASVLFFFSMNIITTSIEFWFNVPIEQALENSLRVGRSLYNRTETHSHFFLERAAYQIKTKRMLEEKRRNTLTNYIQIVQREFNFDAVEAYGVNASRLVYATAPALENLPFPVIGADKLLRDIPIRGVRTITETVPTGELVRTIGTVPFGVRLEDAQGFIVMTVRMPAAVAENLQSISRGVNEYQQIKLIKRPIQLTYYITLSIVALLVVFCAVWFGFYLAKTITIPIQELAEGTRRVAEGDLSFSIPLVADDEIGSLVDSFNHMTRDLRVSREQLELSAKMLREQNAEIEEKRQFLDAVLKNVSAGVVTLSANWVVQTVNKSAEKMLTIRAADVLQQPFLNVVGSDQRALAEEVLTRVSSTGTETAELPVRITVRGRPRSFLVTLSALNDDAGNHMGVVIVFDDLTELEKAQRMAAWREVARRIAHEVKNPLTPITLSAQRLQRKYASQIPDTVFEECVRMIIDHVELIRNLVNEFSAFARFPTARPEPCSLPTIIDETIALYREGHPKVAFNATSPEGMPKVNVDRQQIKQAMINLMDNAIAAMHARGLIEVYMTVDEERRRVRLAVADSGPGIPDPDKSRLFEPNFSTKKSGMGLGLTIVHSIVTDHQGTVRVEDNPAGGAVFIMELPMA